MQYASLGLPLVHVGKVRELYEMPGGDRLLMVATDHVSAFDHVLASEIPDKGVVLTQLSVWWFNQLDDLVDNHLLTTRVPDEVAGRALVVERLRMVPIEAVARGYLTGSGWVEYQQTQSVCGIELPAGLHNGSRLPEPIFTPARKAAMGEHDENISFTQMCEITGVALGERLRETTLEVYGRAERIARERGIILADTKFEFGQRDDGTLVLADEVLTPDSSRFWDAQAWAAGELLSFDKQYLRDWLVNESGWSGEGEPPALPAEVIAATRARYLDAYQRLTGRTLVLRPRQGPRAGPRR